MIRLVVLTFCILLTPGCLLFLEEPADFPASDANTSCHVDAAIVDAWEFENQGRDEDASSDESP